MIRRRRTLNIQSSINNIQCFICGTFLVPDFWGPQPLQGKFPVCPLASQSNTFNTRLKIFPISVFFAKLVSIFWATSTPRLCVHWNFYIPGFHRLKRPSRSCPSAVAKHRLWRPVGRWRSFRFRC